MVPYKISAASEFPPGTGRDILQQTTLKINNNNNIRLRLARRLRDGVAEVYALVNIQNNNNNNIIMRVLPENVSYA